MRKYIQVYVSEFVYGSIDGLITTFAIVMSAIGAGLSPVIILVVGFANVLADAFSMGSSNYLAEKSQEALQGSEHAITPFKRATVTFLSFVALGIVPLVPFLIALAAPSFQENAALYSIIVTGIAFASVGFASGSLTHSNPYFAALRTVLIGGVAAAIAFGVGRGLAIAFGV